MPNALTLIESDTFELTHNAAHQLLRARWLVPVLDADLRGHYAELLAAAQRHAGCGYWLLDMTQRNWHMPSFGPWFGTEFAPAVRAALGRPVYLAYVLSPRHHTIAQSPRTQQEQVQCVGHEVYTCTFTSEAAALDWLRHQQRLAGPAPG